jgi:hypothetical protein
MQTKDYENEIWNDYDLTPHVLRVHLFVGEKRERSESMETELEEVGGWARQNHEWLFETVSGAGGWKPGKEGKTKFKSSKYSKDNTGAAGKGYYPK